MAEATCTKCHQTKPVGEFGVDRHRPSGLNTWCRACLNDYARGRYRATREAKWDVGEITSTCQHCGGEFTYVKKTGPRRMYCTERCKANAAQAKKSKKPRVCGCGSAEVPKVGKPVCRNCRKIDRDRTEGNRVRRFKLYGITEAIFDEMLAMQRGQCAVCATTEPGTRGWFVDHDHACCPGIGSCGNCIRGLLCHSCNIMLGNARDSVEILDRAKKYLIANSQFKLPLRVVKNGE